MLAGLSTSVYDPARLGEARRRWQHEIQALRAQLIAENADLLEPLGRTRAQAVAPEDFGARGDGVSDDTAALQKALDSARSVVLGAGKVYGITAELVSAADGITITGGGAVKFLPGFDKSGRTLSALRITGKNTTLDAVTFDGSAVTGAGLNNRFVWCVSPGLKVTRNAAFLKLPKGGSNFNGAIGCNAAAAGARVIGAYFSDNPGAVFVQGPDCVISGNVIVNPNDVAIAFNSTNCRNGIAMGNTIDNQANNSCAALIAAEEGASTWTVQNNLLHGIRDGAGFYALNVAVKTRVHGGKVLGNVMDGGSGTTKNPCALVAVTPFYENVMIADNLMFGCPSGNSNSRVLIVPATGSRVERNILDAQGTQGLGAMVGIRAGGGGAEFADNLTRAAAGGRHYLFEAGDYENKPVSFNGGRIVGGAEGINAELGAAGIKNLDLHMCNIRENSARRLVNARTLLGERADWLNGGAWSRPHCIRSNTYMYGMGIPAQGGFANGDMIYFMFPERHGILGVVRVAGQWQPMGKLV